MAFYILNTNRQWDEKCEENMLENHTASAYGLPWGNNIKKLNIDDLVFLYGNINGLLAYGVVDSDLKLKEFIHNEKIYNEYYRNLDNFRILKTPISASEMKKITNKNYVYNTTMFSISCSEAVQFIEKINTHHI